MKYLEFSPNKELSSLIYNYWVFEIPQSEEIVSSIQHFSIPDPCVSIVIINQPYFNGVRILGQHTSAYHQEIYPNSIFLGIRFHPWVVFNERYIDKIKTLNSTAEASPEIETHFKSMLGRKRQTDFSDFTELDTALKNFVDEIKPGIDPLTRYICIKLSNEESISEITNSIHLSKRNIQKSFKKSAGVTMKQYSSSVRQRKIWEKILTKELSPHSAILEHGFFDQAHFINSFKKKTKLTPKEFREYHNKINLSLLK